jgi:hypothetical protein
MSAALRAVLAYEQELKTQVDDVQVSCRQIADVLNNNELQQEEDDGKLQFVPDIVKGLALDAAETEDSIAVMMTALKAIEQRVRQVQAQKATAADDQEVCAVIVLYHMYTMTQARLANSAEIANASIAMYDDLPKCRLRQTSKQSSTRSLPKRKLLLRTQTTRPQIATRRSWSTCLQWKTRTMTWL